MSLAIRRKRSLASRLAKSELSLRNSTCATSAKNSVAANMTTCATAGVTAVTTGASRLICDGSTFTVLAAGGISVFCRSRKAASGQSRT